MKIVKNKIYNSPGGTISGSGTADYLAMFITKKKIGNSPLYRSAGNVGIAKTIDANTGVFLKGTDRFLYDFTPAGSDGRNTFLGVNAGNFTMSISGGASSLASNNSGVGADVLAGLTTGFNNTGLGVDSARSITTGSNIVAIGYSSGYGVGDLRSTIDTQMVFIGALASRDSSVLTTSAITNGIAIGYNAKVSTSNTVVLGNDSITTTLLKGNVGIGTIPGTGKRLHIKGSGSTSSTIALQVDSSTTANSFVIDDAGNVGIGTTPSSTLALYIVRSGSPARIGLVSLNAADSQLLSFAGTGSQWNFGQTNNDGRLKISKDNNGDLAIQGFSFENDNANYSTLRFTTTATGFTTSDGLVIGYDATLGAAVIQNHESTPIIFKTANTDRGRIDASGNWGIGVSPTTGVRLYVKGSGNTSSTNALIVESVGVTNMLVIGDDGRFGFRRVAADSNTYYFKGHGDSNSSNVVAFQNSLGTDFMTLSNGGIFTHIGNQSFIMCKTSTMSNGAARFYVASSGGVDRGAFELFAGDAGILIKCYSHNTRMYHIKLIVTIT